MKHFALASFNTRAVASATEAVAWITAADISQGLLVPDAAAQQL